jgi:hypothetical protein
MRRSAVGVALLLLAGDAAAQAVRGRVMTRDSTVVPGAIVTLLDSAGTPLARALADDAGRFAMRTPAAGRYAFQVLRLGFAPTVDAAFRIRQGEIAERTVVLTGRPISLRAIRGTPDHQCVGPDSASAAFAVWEEAQKALIASHLTRLTRAYKMDLELFSNRQASDAREKPILSRNELRSASLRPFVTLPPDQLASDGYVERSNSGDTYYAPDEEVLLSESFASTHCMKLLPDDGPADLVRLGFTPVPNRLLPDIRGVLTVDRATNELRGLEFSFVNLRPPEMIGSPGGEIVFRHLPEGSWIIEYWALGIPFYETRVNRDEVRPVPGRGVSQPVPRPQQVNVGTGRLTTGGGVTRVTFGNTVVWEALERPTPRIRVPLPPD